MLKTQFKDSGRMHSVDFRAVRPMHVRPTIIKTIKMRGKVYYIDLAGKLYDAEVMDKIFGKERKVKVNKKHKGVAKYFNQKPLQ